mgnify:CR=1 FL=1
MSEARTPARPAAPAEPAAPGRGERRAMLAILLLALLVRLVALPVAPTEGLPDAISYRTAGAAFFTDGGITNPYLMPFYPLVLALGSGARGWQIVVDLVASLAIVWLIGALARRLFRSAAAGLLGALMAALYPMAIFYGVVGLSESVFVALVLGAYLALYDRRFLLSSVIFVLAILTRPALEIFAPFVLVWTILVVHRLGAVRAGRALVVYGLVYVVLMAPWWLHNYERYGSFVRLHLASGFVLYSGNNPQNASGGGIGGVDLDTTKFADIADPVERDRRYKEAAVAFIKEDPARFGRLALVKFQRMWRMTPFAPEYRDNPAAILATLAFLPVFLLALATVVRHWRRFWYLSPIYGFFAFTTLVHMITIASLRYRFPLEPFAIVLAAPTMAAIAARLPLVGPFLDRTTRADAAASEQAR